MSSLNTARSAKDCRTVIPFRSRDPEQPRLFSRVRPIAGVKKNCGPFPGVEDELGWRQRPAARTASGIALGRWREDASQARRYELAGNAECVTIELALRPMDLSLAVDGRQVYNGKAPSGWAHITNAGSAPSAEFRSPCDVLHLFVPTELIAGVNNKGGALLLSAEKSGLPVADPAIERMAWLLLKSAEFDVSAANLYVEGISLAIIARLCSQARPGGCSSERQGLVKWRLKRVFEYVEAELSEPLSLADLARAAGLSRMHFAAQFRAATGIRPHEYLMRRRIERAQEILRTTSMPLAEVALSVGFQTQAHFTTVFRRLLDETPGRWRELRQAGCSAMDLHGERRPSNR